MRLGYTETYYTDVMKTLCNYLNRLDMKEAKRKWRTDKRAHKMRDVEYGSGKYHYIEKVWDNVTFSIWDKSPMSMIKQIIERANSLLYD